MSELMRLDEEYRSWIQELGDRYRTSQIKASIRVNNEMLMYYWSVGKDITERRAGSKWGNKFFQHMSMDLADMIPNAKGFSPTNLRYMMRFYELFKDVEIILQVGENLLAKNENQIVPQLEEQFKMVNNKVFMIPWGHIKLLIDKCHDNAEKFNFYIDKIIENNWSRAVLLNFLDTDLFERQGKAITNFKYTLPEETGDLAQEITKDPYNFDFVAIRQGYNEKELKDALMDNVQNFLMELGTGFAFVGREYRLQVGNTEQFIDMLFYNIKRHCYMVVEVKVVEFEPGFISQTATYVSAVNHTLKGDGDTQTIGLGEYGVFAGQSATIQMPTSSGKTKSVALIILASFLGKRANNAVVVAPFRSLCREISEELQKAFLFSDKIHVNEVSDVMQMDLLEVLLNEGETEEKHVFVVTPEKLLFILRQDILFLANVGLIIFDEGHLFDDMSRGITYELLISTIKFYMRDKMQKILISAVIPNAEQVNEWITNGKGVVIKNNILQTTEKVVGIADIKINRKCY